MYEYITGRVETLSPTAAVLEAGGIGYWLNISLQTFSQIGDRAEVRLYTHFVVREDAQVLYGFFSREERDIFRALLGVSGVGGNTARMILSAFTADEVRTIIAAGQADVLKSVKGLGIKTAQKIIVELRDKIGGAAAAAGGRRNVRRGAFGPDDARFCPAGQREGAPRAAERDACGYGRGARETSAQAPVRNFVGCVARVNLTRLLQVYAILFYFCCRI